MKKNIGNVGKLIRYVIAIAALYFVYSGVESPWSYILYVVAGIMAITAILGYCPLYSIVGFSETKEKR
jgi:hypothetical protein